MKKIILVILLLFIVGCEKQEQVKRKITIYNIPKDVVVYEKIGYFSAALKSIGEIEVIDKKTNKIDSIYFNKYHFYYIIEEID